MNKMNWFRSIMGIVWLSAFTGCATLWPLPKDDMAARRLIHTVQHHNTELKQYKALANVSIDTDGKTLSGRVAMAAVMPDRLRIEWLSAVGQPVTRLAGDGTQISVAIPGETRIRRMPQTSASLDRLIHIPIGIEVLQSMTTGRPQLPDFSVAQIVSQDDQRVVIALRDRWHRLLAKIDVDPIRGRLMRMEHLDKDEAPLYAIRWETWKPAEQYEIPKRVELTTPSGRRLALSMARFWPNVDVSPSLFQLTLPLLHSDSGKGRD